MLLLLIDYCCCYNLLLLLLIRKARLLLPMLLLFYCNCIAAATTADTAVRLLLLLHNFIPSTLWFSPNHPLECVCERETISPLHFGRPVQSNTVNTDREGPQKVSVLTGCHIMWVEFRKGVRAFYPQRQLANCL